MDEDAFDAAIEKRQREIKKKFLEALRELPIIQYACTKSGIGRTTYYRWQGEDTVFAQKCEQALQQGRDFISDMSESQIIQLMKEKHYSASVFLLKHNSARYGARALSRTQPTQMPELSKKEARLFKDALALSSSTKKHAYVKRNEQKKIG